MPGKHAPASGTKKASAADSFKLIKGISRQIESRLHQARVLTYDQLAAITPANLAELIGEVPGVSEQRIVEQDWVSQARALADKRAAQQEEEQARGSQLENIGFVVDLFLDEGRRVHKTQALQVKSGEGEEWEGWDEGRLLNFFVRRAELSLPERPHAATQLNNSSQAAADNAPTATDAATPQPGQVTLRGVEMIPAHTQRASKLLKRGQPFAVRLPFQIAGLPPEGAFSYTARICAKRPGERAGHVLRQAQGTINAGDDAIIVNIAQADLPPGTYQMEAALEITPSLAAPPNTLSSSAREMLQVY